MFTSYFDYIQFDLYLGLLFVEIDSDFPIKYFQTIELKILITENDIMRQYKFILIEL